MAGRADRVLPEACAATVARAVRDEVLRRGWHRVILLGSEADMREAHFKAPLAKAGLMVLTPGPADRAWLGQVASALAEDDAASRETMVRFERLVADGAEHGVDALVVTSPEMRALVGHASIDLPIVDAQRVYESALVDTAMGEGEIV